MNANEERLSKKLVFSFNSISYSRSLASISGKKNNSLMLFDNFLPN